MKNKQGLTLIETLISITLFSILSAAAASLIVSSINLRENSQRSLKSEQFIKQVFEQHKDFWSVKENYKLVPDYLFADQFLQDFPNDISLAIEYSCLSTNGTILGTDGTTLNCDEESPPLRRVEISIIRDNAIVAHQTTDIGKPIASKSN